MKKIANSFVLLALVTNLTAYVAASKSITFKNNTGAPLEVELCTCKDSKNSCTCKTPLPYINLPRGSRTQTTTADRFRVSKFDGKSVRGKWSDVIDARSYPFTYKSTSSEVCMKVGADSTCSKVVK